jgi:hypothetical protein
MVIPHSNMFSPRSFAQEATRRAVRAMYYHCGVPVQAISEYTLGDYAGQAKLIVVPSPRVLTLKCWEMLKAEAQRGAVVAISGPITKNEYGIPTGPRPDILLYTRVRPVAASETITINGREYLVRYEGEKLQRLEKGWLAPPDNPPVFPVVNVLGAGKLVWSPLPLELGDSMPALAEFYRTALTQARISPLFTAVPQTPAVLILPSVFRDVVLYTFVSEISRDTRMQVTHVESQTRFNVTVPAQRTAMVLIDRKTGKVLATDERG